jgi:ATP-dependent DNA helicase RecG
VACQLGLRFCFSAGSRGGRPAREQVWDYPLDALREALVNAVCHRDYTESSTTDVRIYDDRLEVWSPGGLPLGITVTDLYGPHRSVLRNKDIAQVLFDIGWIERWGSGTGKIRDLCAQAGLPEPEFLETQQSLRVIFRKDAYSEEYLRKLGFNERQIAAVKYVRENARVTSKSYQELNHVSRQTASNELSALAEQHIFMRTGKAGRGIAYELPKLPNK